MSHSWGYEVIFWCDGCKQIYLSSLDDPLKKWCPRCDSDNTMRYEKKLEELNGKR